MFAVYSELMDPLLRDLETLFLLVVLPVNTSNTDSPTVLERYRELQEVVTDIEAGFWFSQNSQVQEEQNVEAKSVLNSRGLGRAAVLHGEVARHGSRRTKRRWKSEKMEEGVFSCDTLTGRVTGWLGYLTTGSSIILDDGDEKGSRVVGMLSMGGTNWQFRTRFNFYIPIISLGNSGPGGILSWRRPLGMDCRESSSLLSSISGLFGDTECSVNNDRGQDR